MSNKRKLKPKPERRTPTTDEIVADAVAITDEIVAAARIDDQSLENTITQRLPRGTLLATSRVVAALLAQRVVELERDRQGGGSAT